MRTSAHATWPARDYNRGLAAPMRWMHMGASLPGVARAWFVAPERRAWAIPAFWSVLVLGVLIPTDRWTSGLLRDWHAKLGGDPKRELAALQQFGQFAVTALGMLLVWRLDPARRWLLWTWLAAIALSMAMYQPMKMLIGRPRPKFDDPWHFLGPLGQYPIDSKVGVRHAWEFWSGISSDLWSMPSSHTAAAIVMALVLGRAYPSIRGVLVALAVLVGVMRVMTGAHYPSDVVVGGLVGWFASDWAWRATGAHVAVPSATTQSHA